MYKKHPDHFSFNGFHVNRIWDPTLETWHFEDERFSFNGIISFTGETAIGGTRWLDETPFSRALYTWS